MKDHVRELLIQVRNGDEQAFSQLFTLYQRSVYVKANRILQSDADAQDVVQETFLIVHDKLHQLRELDLFYSWLMQITVSRCHLHFRKEKHYANNSDGSELYQLKEERVYLDPIKTADNENERDILLDFINLLAPKKAEVLKLMYLKEMKLQEIAEYLDIPVNTVKTRAVRGREELKQLIIEYERKEQIKLHFHMDAILPISLFTISAHPSIVMMIKQKLTESITFVQSHAAISVCTCSLTALTISGGVFVVQDYEAQKDIDMPKVSANMTQQEQQESPPPITEEEQPVVEALPQAAFTPVTYQDTQIDTIREGYYACLNFAETEEQMKSHTKEEFQALLPLVKNLKESASPYYKQLEEQGWVALFELYL